MDYAEGVWISAESVVFLVLIYVSSNLKSIHLWKQNKSPDRTNTEKDIDSLTNLYYKILWEIVSLIIKNTCSVFCSNDHFSNSGCLTMTTVLTTIYVDLNRLNFCHSKKSIDLKIFSMGHQSILISRRFL